MLESGSLVTTATFTLLLTETHLLSLRGKGPWGSQFSCHLKSIHSTPLSTMSYQRPSSISQCEDFPPSPTTKLRNRQLPEWVLCYKLHYNYRWMNQIEILLCLFWDISTYQFTNKTMRSKFIRETKIENKSHSISTTCQLNLTICWQHDKRHNM